MTHCLLLLLLSRDIVECRNSPLTVSSYSKIYYHSVTLYHTVEVSSPELHPLSSSLSLVLSKDSLHSR